MNYIIHTLYSDSYDKLSVVLLLLQNNLEFFPLLFDLQLLVAYDVDTNEVLYYSVYQRNELHNQQHVHQDVNEQILIMLVFHFF